MHRRLRPNSRLAISAAASHVDYKKLLERVKRMETQIADLQRDLHQLIDAHRHVPKPALQTEEPSPVFRFSLLDTPPYSVGPLTQLAQLVEDDIDDEETQPPAIYSFGD